MRLFSYPTIFHKLLGLRRKPMSNERAKHILDRARLYAELTPFRRTFYNAKPR